MRWVVVVVVEEFEFKIKKGRWGAVWLHTCLLLPLAFAFYSVFCELMSWTSVVGEEAGSLVCCGRVSSSQKKVVAEVNSERGLLSQKNVRFQLCGIIDYSDVHNQLYLYFAKNNRLSCYHNQLCVKFYIHNLLSCFNNLFCGSLFIFIEFWFLSEVCFHALRLLVVIFIDVYRCWSTSFWCAVVDELPLVLFLSL